jgi:hypothetical protein
MFLFAILVLASSASASVAVISSGIFQNNWGGTNRQGYGSSNPLFTAGTFEGQAVAMVDKASGGWTVIGRPDATSSENVSGMAYLEYVCYFDTVDGTRGAYSECTNWYINGLNSQYQGQAVLKITDMGTGVTISRTSYDAAPLSDWGGGDKWIHVSLALKPNGFGVDEYGTYDIDVTSVGAIRFGAYNTLDAAVGIKMYISDMAFTVSGTELVPEPGTICLLGLGGLALVRRKRS